MAYGRKRTPVLDQWMSVPKAATALGESKLSVLSRIIRGELVSQQMDGRAVVRRDTVDALLATRSDDEGRVA